VRKGARWREVVDWSAFTVLPGLIDLHTHLADLGQSADLAAPIKASPAETALVGARNARVTLDAGFTSVRDVGTYRGLTDVTLRNAIERGDVPGPRMWVAGAYLTIPKGGGELNGVVPNEQLPPDMRLGVAATPEEAAAEDDVSCSTMAPTSSRRSRPARCSRSAPNPARPK
jgi:imidazolonepropionase-like amidohydrolase